MPSSLRSCVGAALFVAAVWSAAACSDPPPDPDAERLDRIEARLDETFSGAQVACILDVLDDDTLRALDRSADLDPDTDVFAAYSAVVASCVADPEARPDPMPTGGPDGPDAGSPGADDPGGGEPVDDEPTDDEPGGDEPGA